MNVIRQSDETFLTYLRYLLYNNQEIYYVEAHSNRNLT